MNIKSIQPSQVVPTDLRSSERNSSKANAETRLASVQSTRVTAGSSASTNATQVPLVQAQALVNQIDYIKEQLDEILVDFPPFWPPGTFQRADLIQGIRNIQDEVEKSSVASPRKQDIASEKLTENATDNDISAALDKLMSFRDEIAKNIPETAESVEPGTMVSIKV
jgi:hypothetical protein